MLLCTLVYRYLWIPTFSSFRYKPWSRIAGSYGTSMFNLLRNCQSILQWLHYFTVSLAIHKSESASTGLQYQTVHRCQSDERLWSRRSGMLGMYPWLTASVLCLVAQLCPTLCDPMDCSPQGHSVCGVSQARILEWFAISVSKNYAMYITITLHWFSI